MKIRMTASDLIALLEPGAKHKKAAIITKYGIDDKKRVLERALKSGKWDIVR